MITVAISVPEEQTELWLDAVANTTLVREVELPAALLNDPEPLLRLLRPRGLAPAHAARFLPPGFGPRFAESADATRAAFTQQLQTALARCRDCGVRHVSLDLNEDDICVLEAARPDTLQCWAGLVRKLLPVAVDAGITLEIPVRHPAPFPGSRNWTGAANLVQEVMHPACRLELNVALSELPEDFDLAAVARSCFFHLAALRLHYVPAEGETPDPARHRQWGAALARLGFKGAVVFCPRAGTPEGIRDACRRVDELAAAYRGGAGRA